MRIMSEVEDIANENAKVSGGSFTKTNSMKEAFEGADFVYPKLGSIQGNAEEDRSFYGAGDMTGSGS